MQTLRVRHVPWSNPVGLGLREAFRAELSRGGPDVEPPDAGEDGTEITAFLVAYELSTGQPVGCGGLRTLGSDRVGADYVYVLPYARWSGISHAIIDELAAWARVRGLTLTGPEEPMLRFGFSRRRVGPG